tara:strand:- start:1545 stop:2123 length:579 start_codon:yes stop_codon:yes gene_type:complete
MKQMKLDHFFNINYKKNTKELNKSTSILNNTSTPNNTPNYTSTISENINNEVLNSFQLTEKIPNYLLRFDGASKGNPGKSGCGAVIYLNNNEIWNGVKYTGVQTNNYAEYYGMIIGLEEAVKKGIKEISVEGDSMLVIKQMLGHYRVKSDNLKELFKKSKELQLNFDSINFKHIYRNKNSRADELANKSLIL